MPEKILQFKDIHQDRVRALNDAERRDDRRYVLYWMQQSQRAEWNHALEYAVRAANELEKGLIVGFGLMKNYPDANLRHYHFMVEGLLEVQKALAERDIQFVLRFGEPPQVCLDLAEDAALVICDRGYLRHQRQWRGQVARQADVQVIQVESDLVVPLETASEKEEHAARTIRPKLMKRYEPYLAVPTHHTARTSSRNYSIDKVKFSSVDAVLEQLDVDRSVQPVAEFRGGTSEAERRFRNFLNDHLDQYMEHRNQPHLEHVSHMSMYLHFGQISPCYLLAEIREGAITEDKKSYIEELLVRRELTHNYVYYNDNYDNWNGLPAWARESLEQHQDDPREKIYTREQLEKAETDDPYWNAAMTEMKQRGYLHNHMRMYWGKQLLRYTNTPRYAYETALYLNNKYFLDGRDANSYANISWLFGQHDRPWPERDIYGKVRTMTPGGLKRKTEPEKFVEKVARYGG